MTYVFSIWACYVLYMEYKTVATMRLRHLASETRRPDQLTVSYSIFLSICYALFALFFIVLAFMFL